MITHTIRDLTRAEIRFLRYHYKHHNELLEKILRNGRVHSFRCKSVRCIELDYEDAVTSAWIFVGDNHVALYTTGQVVIEEPDFPCDDFELIYDGVEKHLFTIKKHGKNNVSVDEWLSVGYQNPRVESYKNDALWNEVGEATYSKMEDFGYQYPLTFHVDSELSAEHILQTLITSTNGETDESR